MAVFPSPFNAGRQAHGTNFVIINGRRVPVEEGVRGDALGRMADAGPGRRPVKVADGRSELLDPSHRYSAADLTDRHGRPVKITSIPDRTKGAELYTGRRDAWSAAIIREQVYDLAGKFVRGNVDFDEDNADWMVIPQFRLPANWSVPSTSMLLVFPREYPVNPPIGFYLPASLVSPNGHFYGQAYHGASSAPTLEGWNWYCCTVNAGSWRPSPVRYSGDWRRGDNLWTYITLINEVLASPAHAA